MCLAWGYSILANTCLPTTSVHSGVECAGWKGGEEMGRWVVGWLFLCMGRETVLVDKDGGQVGDSSKGCRIY